MPIIKLPSGFKKENKAHVANLHTALTALKMNIAQKALSEKRIEATTTAALKKIQEEFKLPVTGEPDERTLSALNTQVQDQFITANKYHTSKLQSLLDKLKIDISRIRKTKKGESLFYLFKVIIDFFKSSNYNWLPAIN